MIVQIPLFEKIQGSTLERNRKHSGKEEALCAFLHDFGDFKEGSPLSNSMWRCEKFFLKRFTQAPMM